MAQSTAIVGQNGNHNTANVGQDTNTSAKASIDVYGADNNTFITQNHNRDVNGTIKVTAWGTNNEAGIETTNVNHGSAYIAMHGGSIGTAYITQSKNSETTVCNIIKQIFDQKSPVIRWGLSIQGVLLCLPLSLSTPIPSHG